MKLIKPKQNTTVIYKDNYINLQNRQYLLPDTFFLEEGSFLAFSIHKEFYDSLNQKINENTKHVLFIVDTDIFGLLKLLSIINNLKHIDVKVYSFTDASFLEIFGISVMKHPPGVDEFLDFDRVYVFFDLDKDSFEYTVGVKPEEYIKIERKPQNSIVFINSTHQIYEANINTDGIEYKTLGVEEEYISKSHFNKVLEHLKISECIISPSPWIAYLCHMAKVPCLFLVGGFDVKAFTNSHVKFLKNPYVGFSCVAPCGKHLNQKCQEAIIKESAISVCMNFNIKKEDIQDAILKFDAKEDICPYCDSIAYVEDVKNAVVFRKCSACKTIFADKEIEQLNISNGMQFFGSLRYETLLNHKDGIYHQAYFHPSLSYIAKLLEDTKSKTILIVDAIELCIYLKDNNDVYFYSKSQKLKDFAKFVLDLNIVDDLSKHFDIAIIQDISFYSKAFIQSISCDTLIVSAPNQERFNKQKYVAFESKNAYFSIDAIKSLIQKDHRNNTYILSTPDYYENQKHALFGAVFTQNLSINNVNSPTIFDDNNLMASLEDTLLGDYIIGISSKDEIPVEQISKYVKFRKELELKRDNDVFKTHSNFYKEPYIEIYKEGNHQKVLLMDHYELVMNVPKLFAEAGFTVGIVRKESPYINMDKLEKEVLDFSPDFMFSMFWGDLFWMRDENRWDYKTRDFWFKFNFPIISYKVDLPMISNYQLTEKGIELLRKYKQKTAIIYQDSYTAELFRSLGIDAYWFPNFFTFDYIESKHLQNKSKSIDVLFAGSLHEENQDIISKYKKSFDCYFNNVENILDCITGKPIVNEYFNTEFFDEMLSVISQTRAIYVKVIKERYNAFVFDKYRLPITLLGNLLSKTKISFYIHSQGINCIHDMAFLPLLFDALPIVDRHKEAYILFPEHYKYFTYTNLEEALRLIDYYLSHEDERLALIKELKHIKQTYHKDQFMDFVLDIYKKKKTNLNPL